jgi:hypothetical protein
VFVAFPQSKRTTDTPMEVSSPLRRLSRDHISRDACGNAALAINVFEIYTSSGRVIGASE